MRRVALIFNPMSGQHPEGRAAQIADVAAVLLRAGIEVRVIATESPESAGRQAQEAVRGGCDTVLACGGDGTVHEVLQRLVGGTAALGVIPMGTANALAADLGLPASPVKAVKILLDATPVRISVGHLFYQSVEGGERSRYFIVAAGVGADAFFFSRLDSRLKQRFGGGGVPTAGGAHQQLWRAGREPRSRRLHQQWQAAGDCFQDIQPGSVSAIFDRRTVRTA
jgi:diacylglycerol kinase (ATP)